MQTPSELIDSMLRKKPFDRVGFNDYPWDDTLKKWVDTGQYPTNEHGSPINPIDHFNFDMANVGGWFDVKPLAGYSEVIEETDAWIVKRDGAGAAFKYWKNKSGTPEHIDFRMSSRRIWEKDYKPHLLETDRSRVDIAGAKKKLSNRRAEGKWTYYGHLFVWENMRQCLGDVCMYESLALDPGWILDFNRTYADVFKTYFRILIEEAGRPDGIWLYEDLGYKGRLFCSPKMLHKYVFPFYADIVEFFKQWDLPVVLHSCGYITQILPHIVDLGFAGLNPMEVKAGCDPLAYAEQYGDKLTFFGGLDERVLESGNRDHIRHEVVRLVEGMKSLGVGYVFGSDHSLSTLIDYADFQYAIDVYRDHMMI